MPQDNHITKEAKAVRSDIHYGISRYSVFNSQLKKEAFNNPRAPHNQKFIKPAAKKVKE
jgi:hypothetical protein